VTVPSPLRPGTTVFGAGSAAIAIAFFGRSTRPPVIAVLPLTVSLLVSKPHEEETEPAVSVARAEQCGGRPPDRGGRGYGVGVCR